MTAVSPITTPVPWSSMMPLPTGTLGLISVWKDKARPALQIKRQVASAIVPQRVGEPVRLDGVIALEIEQGLDGTMAGRIAFERGAEVRAGRLADLGIGDQHVLEGLTDEIARQIAVIEPRGQPEGQRRFECSRG